MTKEEIIKALRDMARYPTVTLPRDSEALKMAADLLAQPDPYAKGYADAMNWKVQNHLEHLPAAQPEQEPDAYGYASRLATHIWQKHYMKDAPKWKPLDDLMGVLTQIDNMTSGLTRLSQPEQEPMATVTSESGHPNVTMSWWHEPALPIGTKLYTTPPQRTWVGLTDEEIDHFCHLAYTGDEELVLTIQEKLKEKNA